MKTKMMAVAALGMSFLMAGPAFAAKVDRREKRQQERIEKGEKSGQLTAKEAGKLEKREGQIDEQKKMERAENGGKLTPAERKQINREQNNASKAIYNQKHDAQTQPGVTPAAAKP